jgi:hypothetical protein
MSPATNKISTDLFSPDTPKTILSYMIARTSRWQLDFLFLTFLHDKPDEIRHDVQVNRRAISWDLKAIHHLRRCLTAWVQDKIPGDAIGAFLVHILYEQDYHLDYKLTAMVREHRTQLHIARHVLCFYQIRDEGGISLWDKLAVYPDEGAAGTAPKTASEPTPCVPTTEEADPRWPLFLNGLSNEKLDEITDKLGEYGELSDEKNLPPLFSGISDEDMPIIESFRRFNIHSNDCSDDIPRLQANYKALESQEKKPLPICPSRKPPSALSADIPMSDLPTGIPLPLSPLKRAKALVSESVRVRVRTFNTEKKPKIRFTPDTKPGMAVVDNVQNTHASSSASAKSVDLDKALPPTPSDPDFGSARWDYKYPPPLSVVKRKGGVEDLRKS